MTDKTFALHHLVRPATRDADKAPLLVLLHGFMEDEAAMHRLIPALDQRFCVVSVRAPIPTKRDATKYAWARVRFTPDGPDDAAEDFETSRRMLLRLRDELLSAYGLDSRRVYLMGFSQGASLALGLAMSSADRFAGAVAMSGKLLEQYLEIAGPPAALNGMPILVAHGSQDRLVPVWRTRRDNELLAKLPVDLTYREYPMGHEMSAESLYDAATWLGEKLEPPSSS